MSLAVRAVSLDRGIDPRDTVMIAFGGAGPLHALAIAREIAIPRVVIPRLPGNFSALGMLMAQWRHDFVRTLIGTLGEIAPVDAGRAFAELRRAGEESLGAEQLACGRFEFAADLRYRGQEHTISVRVRDVGDVTTDLDATRLRFNREHEAATAMPRLTSRSRWSNLRLVVTVPRMEEAIGRWLSQPWCSDDACPSSVALSFSTIRSIRSRRASYGDRALRQGPRSPDPL